MMEFDINLILVPITLVFLVAYLADKFFLKQHRLAKDNNRLLGLAQSHFDDCERAFKQSLKAHYGVDTDPSHYTPNANTPSDVMMLHDDYHAAKRKLAECQSKMHDTKELFLVRWAYEYLPILLVLVLVRAFVVEPFNIPSSSMVPTLHTGDFIVVNKSAYGLRLPLVHTKILNTGSPKHGDVAVFRYPENPKLYYIKRVIGLPGDTISFDHGVLSVNGQKIETKKSQLTMESALIDGLYPKIVNGKIINETERVRLGHEEESYAHYTQEQLGKHTYQVRYLADFNGLQYTPFLQQYAQGLAESGGKSWTLTIPQGKYFTMGDNRDRSGDSRFWGFVDESHLAGKASYIWMHKDAGFSLPSFGRVGAID